MSDEARGVTIFVILLAIWIGIATVVTDALNWDHAWTHFINEPSTTVTVKNCDGVRNKLDGLTAKALRTLKQKLGFDVNNTELTTDQCQKLTKALKNNGTKAPSTGNDVYTGNHSPQNTGDQSRAAAGVISTYDGTEQGDTNGGNCNANDKTADWCIDYDEAHWPRRYDIHVGAGQLALFGSFTTSSSDKKGVYEVIRGPQDVHRTIDDGFLLWVTDSPEGRYAICNTYNSDAKRFVVSDLTGMDCTGVGG